MRYTGPKARLCRKEGVNLFGTEKYAKILAKRPSIPGVHGGKRFRKVSEFGQQLRQKQIAKRMFGLSEKQFRKYFDKAARSSMTTGEKLLEQLERRLDNVIYRAGFAMTRMQARQFASHGLLTVNGKRVKVPSIELGVGDVVEVRENKKSSPIFQRNQETLKTYKAPKWLESNTRKLSVAVTALPEKDDFEHIINTQAIVEFYSR